MTIAINALAMRSLGHGVGNYIANLGLSLAKQFPGDDYTFFIRPDNSDLPAYLNGLPNVNFEVINLPRPIRIFWEQFFLPFKVRGYDILHSPVYVAPILKFTKYILTELDMSVFIEPGKYSLIKRIYFQIMIPLSVKRSDKILAISNSAARDLKRVLNVPRQKIITTPLGVRANLNRENDSQKLAQVISKYRLPHKFVLFLGVLEPRKNVPGLIRAFAEISAKTDLDLVIAGSSGLGWNTARTKQLVHDLKLNARVHFIGTVEESDKGGLYTLSAVFVYPSFYEGFGIPILEAMACGVPVITSHGSSLEEVAGLGALLVDPNKDSEIAQAILEIVNDSSIQNRLIKLGQANVRRFNWSKTATLTHGAYNEKN